MWTCRGCRRQWNGNKKRCDCGRKAPSRKPTQRQIVAELGPFEEWLEQYGEVCNICGSDGGIRRLHRDHDHATGEARGLLCFPCNTALPDRKKPKGMTTVEWLRAAADYLERNQ